MSAIKSVNPSKSSSIVSTSNFTSDKLGILCQRIRNQQMSLFVGAGFSRNAGKNFLDWNTLLLDAAKEMKILHRKKGESNSNYDKRLWDKIAEEGPTIVAEKYVQYKKEKSELDKYIEKYLWNANKSVCKKPYSKNLALHRKLIQIDWNDIFTTNYDTLLETADISGLYEIVKNSKQLKNRNRKRIIKLHGTFRESLKKDPIEFDNSFNHSYIMTKSDFENYRSEHNAFSNLMKVKILESSFCLIGFSGEDSNYIYWTEELRKVLSKGLTEESPNDIIFIDVKRTKISPEQEKKDKERFITRINLDDIIDEIEKENGQETNRIKKERTKHSGSLENEIEIKFDIFFEYLLRKTSENNDYIEQDLVSRISREIIPGKKIPQQVVSDYLRTDLFDYKNIIVTDFWPEVVRHINENQEQIDFDFFSYYCINNYYQLFSFFEEERINELWKVYEKNYINKKGNHYFFELYLSYLRNCDAKKFLQEIKKYEKLAIKHIEDIIMSQKAYFYAETLKFDDLENLLKKWAPEKKKNPRFIMKKISLMRMYNSIRICFQEFDFEELFKIAEKNCKSKQFLLIIYSVHNYYSLCAGKGPINRFKIEQLRKEQYRTISDYKLALEEKKEAKIIPNEKKREIIREDGSKTKIDRLFNFIEMTGIPFEFLISKEEVSRLVDENQKCPFILIKRLLCNSFRYFGESSEEEYLRTIIPNILKSIKDEEFYIDLYKTVFKVIRSRVKKNINVNSYIYVMDEIIKRLQNNNTQKYISFYVNEIKKNSLVIVHPISNGSTWGCKKPFITIISKVSDIKAFKFLFTWIISNYLADEAELNKGTKHSDSEFLSYYYALTQNPLFSQNPDFITEELRKFYKDDIACGGKLCLLAFDYINDEEIKKDVIAFLRNNFSNKVSPDFLKLVPKDEVFKNRIIQIIANSRIGTRTPLVFDPLYIVDKAIKYFIFKESELVFIFEELEKNKYVIGDNERFANQELFYISVLFKKLFPSSIHLQKYYEKYEKAFFNTECYLTDKKWIYEENLKARKEYFSKTLCFISYTENYIDYLDVIEYLLKQICMVNSEENEKPLEDILTFCEIFEDKKFSQNEIIKRNLLAIRDKFLISIPYCYDDLFIMQQIKRIEKIYALSE